MLKPRDNWTWYFDDKENRLMLDLGEDMLFKTNLCRKRLVDHAIDVNTFCVDDATSYQVYLESLSCLDLSQPRQTELALYCVAAKRFHKPVQPKSWFFDEGYFDNQAAEGDIVTLANANGKGQFIVLEVNDGVCLLARVSLDGFLLREGKTLAFGEPIKVMQDRIAGTFHAKLNPTIALVG